MDNLKSLRFNDVVEYAKSVIDNKMYQYENQNLNYMLTKKSNPS